MVKEIKVDVEKLEKINSVEKLEKMTLTQINEAIEGVYVFGKTMKQFTKLTTLTWKLPKALVISIVNKKVNELLETVNNVGKTTLNINRLIRLGLTDDYGNVIGYSIIEPSDIIDFELDDNGEIISEKSRFAD